MNHFLPRLVSVRETKGLLWEGLVIVFVISLRKLVKKPKYTDFFNSHEDMGHMSSKTYTQTQTQTQTHIHTHTHMI